MPLLFLALAAQTFAAGTPAFDPRQHRREIAGKPAQVLVLGSPHLSQLPETLDPTLLEPLLARLTKFKPDVITIEALSGEECETLLHFKPQHDGAWEGYCWATDEIEKMTGLSVPAATTAVTNALATWPAKPTAGQRRHLAMLFIAANERGSAMVQWYRLDPSERHAGDGLTPQLAELLERKGKPPNENYAIGAALAARLGLERIYQVDDHISDGPDLGKGYNDAIQQVWNAKPEPAIRGAYMKRQGALHSSADVMSFYRFLNDPKTQRATIAADMDKAALQSTKELYGRQYLAWWEERNLRMIANIRHAYSYKPDARVLVIVGATHKGYFDAYLNMMQDVRLVDVSPFLR